MRPNKDGLDSAEFPLLIPGLAVPLAKLLPNVGFDVQFGQKLPVLPILGNMESQLKPSQKCIMDVSVERAEE